MRPRHRETGNREMSEVKREPGGFLHAGRDATTSPGKQRPLNLRNCSQFQRFLLGGKGGGALAMIFHTVRPFKLKGRRACAGRYSLRFRSA